jgi:hypothetical protein
MSVTVIYVTPTAEVLAIVGEDGVATLTHPPGLQEQ